MQVYVIPGKPIPWMRSGRRGNKYYDQQMEQKTRYRSIIRTALKGTQPHSDAIKVLIEFHMQIPVTWAKSRRKMAIGKPHKYRADIDNLLKFVNDSLNEHLWVDDSLIYESHAIKVYSEIPETRIYVEPFIGGALNEIISDARANYRF